MRYLIVSDLHANQEALEAVLSDARGQYDRIVCCGDIVGYGPDPDAAADWVRENVHTVIRGNHDRACCGLEDLEWFNPVARAAARWTMATMRPDNIAWLRSLPRGPVALDGFAMAHGSPLDEDEYVTSLSDAANLFDYLECAVTFFGHTHIQGGFFYSEGRRRKIHQDYLRVEPDGLYLINPGSVGQPRDGDPKAAWALFDSDLQTVAFQRTAYDHKAVRRKMELAGLPPELGARLRLGR